MRIGDRGSVLMETVLVMPLLLLLILGIIQFAQIWMARQMVVYAASCAVRAMTVVLPDEQADAADKAAKLALSWLCLVETEEEADARKAGRSGVQVPGWGAIPGSGSVDRRVQTSIYLDGTHFDGTDDGNPLVGATVSFRYPLLLPVMGINTIIGNFTQRQNARSYASADLYGNLAQANAHPIVDIDAWPYINLRETYVLPMPYSPANLPKGGFSGCGINGF